MELQYYGANCLRITTKKSQLITDPYSDITNLQANLNKANIVIATQPHFIPKSTLTESFIINGPGEYEFADCSIKGIAGQPHTGSTGDISATLYRITSGDIRLLLTGHIGSQLTELQLEEIGKIDVVVVPVGGSGYTLDSVGAASLIRALEPKLVIPVHYAEKSLSYDVPQQELEHFVKELGATVEEPLEKLKFKLLPELLTVQALIRQ